MASLYGHLLATTTVLACLISGRDAISVVFVNETETSSVFDELAKNESAAIFEPQTRANESELGEFQLLLPSKVLESGGESSDGAGVVWMRYAKAARMKSVRGKNWFRSGAKCLDC